MILVATLGLALAACARSPEASRAMPGPTAPALEAAVPACQPPLRQCIGCNGAPLCARLCPECPALAAPQSEPVPAALALAPDSGTCGSAICAPGTFCCNASCGICTPKGVFCTQQTCD
jgi:hypothetical protein